jgi:alpha-ketoglutarate-dependent taurine dioxygenase
MIVTQQSDDGLGSVVEGFDLATATEEEISTIKTLVYSTKIVVLKGQKLSPPEFIELGSRLGEIEVYYEPMYHHPEYKEIFVSSNIPQDGKPVGVPQTGKFWHADYQFKPRPFGLTLIYPQVIPKANRGTYFIDMSRAYERLPSHLKEAVAGTTCVHSAGRYFKIRPSDVYRPVIEIINEIQEVTPDVTHPTVVRHPVTGEQILYLSEGFATGLHRASGERVDDGVLRSLLSETGQLDTTFTHQNIHLQTFTEQDLLIWDNRTLIHRALHTTKPEPTESFRVTVHDNHPFYEGIGD